MFDLVLTISNSHFLPVFVTSSSTMVKLQPLLCLYPPPNPRSLWTSLSNFMMLEWILLYRMPIQSLFSLSLSLSLAWTSSQGAVLYPVHGGMPHLYEEYISFFDPVKRVVSRVFTSEFDLERELPVSQ